LKKVLGILLLFIFSQCAWASKKPKPATLDEAILYFEKKWTDKQKEDYRNTPEKEAVSENHFSLGVWIRNEWLYGNKDTALVNHFNRMGIDQPNDMSTIILTSLHRKLNNLPIDLEGQVNYFIEYWKPIKACDEKASLIAQDNFKRFNIGDSITIYMDVDVKFGTRNAILHECPDPEWSFDHKKDLVIKGTVAEKYEYKDKGNMFFKVKISYLNQENTTILFKNARPSDLIEFGLKYLLVKE
jgi:hypothetical protein